MTEKVDPANSLCYGVAHPPARMIRLSLANNNSINAQWWIYEHDSGSELITQSAVNDIAEVITLFTSPTVEETTMIRSLWNCVGGNDLVNERCRLRRRCSRESGHNELRCG